MSIEMQNAFEGDMTFTDESGVKHYAQEENIIEAEVIEQPVEKAESSGNKPIDAASALFGNR